MAKRKLGWKPDKPDIRDEWYHNYRLMPTAAHVDKVVDLRHMCPPVWDQGDLGSCTAHAIAAALEYNLIQQKAPKIYTPSRLFIYYNERLMEGTTTSDAGAEIRDGIKTVATVGYAQETLWPYNTKKFAFHPPVQAYTDAVKHKALKYYRLDNTQLNILRTCLDNQECFVFGATVYDSFYQGDKDGYVPMPSTSDQVEGGHAICCVGYDDFKKVFIIRNSWGDATGDKGYYYMGYDYLTNPNLCDDFWQITVVS